MDFKNKVVVLTGGSNGIGLALSKDFSKEGAKIYSIDLKNPSEKVQNVIFVKADVTNAKQVKNAVSKIKEKVDFYINNAGVMKRGNLLEVKEADYDFLMGINLKGSWLVSKEIIPKLKKNAIVAVTTSRHAIEMDSEPGLYSLSKVALAKMFNLFSKITPFRYKYLFLGPTDTAIARKGVSKKDLEKKKKIMKTPEEVSEIIIKFLKTKKEELIYSTKANKYYSK